MIDHAVVLDTEVIPSLEGAFQPGAGIAVLRGNLAPDSAVIKAAGVAQDMLQCSGPARCFDSEEQALVAINDGVVQQGAVLD